MGYTSSFYEVYRFTKLQKIIILWLRQIFFFGISFFAALGLLFIKAAKPSQFYFIGVLAISIILSKLGVYFLLRQFRAYWSGNNRSIIIVGGSKPAFQLADFFNTNKELGYHLKGIFSDKSQDKNGSIDQSFNFLKENKIDEIYCDIEELEDRHINNFVRLANQNPYTLKFIPSASKPLSQNLNMQYYGYLPVLSIKKKALDMALNRWMKRLFDVFFSLLIIILILSWLTPILWIVVRLDSKGPLFYKHIRYGINYQKFKCFKFRSMTDKIHNNFEHVTKQDDRVTKVGRFLRRTSIDELPQFFNVLIGNMSVVGPRPHMLSFTENYAKLTNKYNFMLRHTIKPGITGLAQIKGYRGEVNSKSDIINRVKFDNFYIENWSILLDFKIILHTIVFIYKGDQKAY